MTADITAEHGWFNHIRQVAPICVHSIHEQVSHETTSQLVSHLHIAESIDRQTDRQSDRQTMRVQAPSHT